MTNFLIVNFGTFAETNRFKAKAIDSGFVTTDLMDSSRPPAGLISTKTGKIRTVRRAGVTTYSFYGLKQKNWRSKVKKSKLYRSEFKKWMDKVIDQPVHCVYLTGHHWGNSILILSWADTIKEFHQATDSNKKKLEFGTGSGRYMVDLNATKLKSECMVLMGFGCNVATGSNSLNYQKFFSSKGKKPIVLGWERTISVPKQNASLKRQVNHRFFDYLETYAQKNSKVPAKDRIKWFYANEPMEIVKAWGYATSFWFRKRSRARDEKGDFYKFRYNKSTQVAEPVKIGRRRRRRRP